MTKNILSIAFLALSFCSISNKADAAAMIELIEIEQNVQIMSIGNVIHVIGGNGMGMEIYNVAGVRVMSCKVEGMEKRFDVNLPKGCYIVKVGKTARKISIK